MKSHSSLSTQHNTDNHKADRLQPHKSLGQNFLRDPNIAHNIVRALEITDGDVLLEIGPGEGALTALLLASPASHIVAVEYDARAVELLTSRFPSEIASNRLRIIHSDILKLTLNNTFINSPAPRNQPFKIVGNIPYYITSEILFWAFDQWATQQGTNETLQKIIPAKMIIMMQKEVAQRITARPRTKEYGILSIASLLVSDPKLLFHVSPQCFFPPPKVTSSVVEFRMKSHSADAVNFRSVHPLVRVAFNQRRKVLTNALSSLLPKDRLPEMLAAAEVRKISYFRSRAEELTPQDFILLYEFINEFR
jgi:16S rRNA (adenine1518-N6/adenine1519-N6)-dimethyltransferase